jgi:2TM domain
MTDGERRAEREAHRRRLRGFGFHLIGYFLVMIVLVPVNMMTDPQRPWFILPMIGWGAVLAVHAAFVMDLFRNLLKRRSK